MFIDFAAIEKELLERRRIGDELARTSDALSYGPLRFSDLVAWSEVMAQWKAIGKAELRPQEKVQ